MFVYKHVSLFYVLSPILLIPYLFAQLSKILALIVEEETRFAQALYVLEKAPDPHWPLYQRIDLNTYFMNLDTIRHITYVRQEFKNIGIILNIIIYTMLSEIFIFWLIV